MSERSLKINKKHKLGNETNQKEKDQTFAHQIKDQSFIGNKRERANNEKNDDIICDKCKSTLEDNYLEINENLNESSIKEFILNCLKIKNNEFQNIFNEIFEEIISKKYVFKNIILCSECFKKNFFKGGIEKIFNINTIINTKDSKNKNIESLTADKKDLNNNELKELENELNETNSKSKNIKILKDIYSLNIQLIINNLKNFKSRYSKIFEKLNLILENNLPLKNKEDIEKYKEELSEINKIIEKLLNDCTSKEKLQSLNINLNNDNNNNKEELLQLLKQIQLEIENITSNGGDSSAPAPEEWGGENTKNNFEGENQDILFNPKKNDLFKKENMDYAGLRNKNISFFNSHMNFNNIDEINNLLVQNKNNSNNINNISTNISTNINNQEEKNNYNNINQLLNLSNISGALNKQQILNYLEKNQVLKKRLGLGNNNPSLSGILSNSQRNNPQSGLNNNLLLNNLIFSGQISPQILNQINNNNNSNNAQLNNLISENNNITNDNSSNINNLLNSTGINNTFAHRPNIDINSANELKNFENLLKIQNLLNLINNNNSLNYLANNNNINTEILLKLLQQQNQTNISPLTTIPGLVNDYNISNLYNNNNNNNIFSNISNLSDLSNTLNLIQSINNQNNNNNLQSQLKQNPTFINQNKNRLSPATKANTISNINNINTNSITNNTLNNTLNTSINNSINNTLNNTLNNNINNTLNNTLNNSLNTSINNSLNNTLCNISNISRNDNNLNVPAGIVGSGSGTNNFLFYPGQQIDRQKDVAAAMLIKMFDNLAREKESKHSLNENNISQANNNKSKISINISNSNVINNDKNQSQITNNGNTGANLENKSIIIESNIFSQKNNNVIKSQNPNLGNKVAENVKGDINISINANQSINK